MQTHVRHNGGPVHSIRSNHEAGPITGTGTGFVCAVAIKSGGRQHVNPISWYFGITAS